jgi:flagella basal body P-ring formation protein FlgA
MGRTVHIVFLTVALAAGIAPASPVEVPLGPGSGHLKREDIARAVVGTVRDGVESAGVRCSVEVCRAPESLPLGPGLWSLRLSLPAAHALRGMLSVPVEVRVDGRAVRRVSVGVLVRTYADVVVTTHRLGRHDEVRSGDIKVVRVETTLLREGMCTGTAALVGRRTTRMVAEGSVMYPWFVEAVPVIHAGDRVQLVVRVGSVTLSTRAVAREDGVPGSRIFVQRTGSRERLHGTVAGDGTVEIRVK